MFIYCFDEEEKNKLQCNLKLFKEQTIDNKPCWIFTVDSDCKFNFDTLDKSKCVVSNRLSFERW